MRFANKTDSKLKDGY